MATYEVVFRIRGSLNTSTVVVRAVDVAAAVELVEATFTGSTVTGTTLLGR